MAPAVPPIRCPWPGSDPLYQTYHDTEWGVPLRDDARLFEFLLLEGAQAGLSWITVLRKRENYRKALHGFDPQRIARYTEKDLARLLGDPGIIRNRLKCEAMITNARAYLELQAKEGSFADFLWQFVDGEPIQNRWRSITEVPASTPISDRLSKELKRRGFRFVGSTICYAHMQATGMVNDHLCDCYRHAELTITP